MTNLTVNAFTKIKMGSQEELGSGKEDRLWNVAKRALPKEATDSDVLHYMRYMADKNKVALDRKNDVSSAELAKLNGKISVPKYAAPTFEAVKKGGQIAPYMQGDSVVGLKQMLICNLTPEQMKGLKIDAGNNVYDADTKKAVALFQKAQGMRVRQDGVVNSATWARLQNPYAKTKDVVDETKTKPSTDQPTKIQNKPTEIKTNASDMTRETKPSEVPKAETKDVGSLDNKSNFDISIKLGTWGIDLSYSNSTAKRTPADAPKTRSFDGKGNDRIKSPANSNDAIQKKMTYESPADEALVTSLASSKNAAEAQAGKRLRSMDMIFYGENVQAGVLQLLHRNRNNAKYVPVIFAQRGNLAQMQMINRLMNPQRKKNAGVL